MVIWMHDVEQRATDQLRWRVSECGTGQHPYHDTIRANLDERVASGVHERCRYRRWHHSVLVTLSGNARSQTAEPAGEAALLLVLLVLVLVVTLLALLLRCGPLTLH